MRMIASRYASKAQPAQVKKFVSRVAHLQAPLKGLSLSSKLADADPLTAPILDNFVVEEDRITCRPGTFKRATVASGVALQALIPYYGTPQNQAMATATELYKPDGTLLQGGFTSGDWHWTAFSNLSEKDFTVMVNGADGVWSWDGKATPAGATVTVTSISNANPAVVTVAPSDITAFSNGMTVIVTGGTGAFEAANGPHGIYNVGSPANSFTLAGVDTSAASGPQTTGLNATPGGSLVKEGVTAPAGKSYIVPNNFQIVLSHMNRLWFADSSLLAVYYLPLQQKSGEVKELPLNALFRRGGTIRAMYTWTVDGGAGLDDQLVIFSSNGECVIYNGTDPDTDLTLVGIFRFDSPMSKHSVIQHGGDLFVLISTGLVAMTTLLRAETEQLGKYDKNVFSLFEQNARAQRGAPGWAVILDHSTGRAICNLPQGAANSYRQAVRFMPNPIWSTWSGLPARCWGWIDNRLFFGDDKGNLYEMNPVYLSDNGQPIRVDVQAAWSSFKTPAQKHFKMILPYIISDGVPRPYVDIRVDYDTTPPFNQPDVSQADPGAMWDTATWDEDFWASGTGPKNDWNGVAAIGRIGAPRMTALILNCTFSIAGWDVIYETGSLL